MKRILALAVREWFCAKTWIVIIALMLVAGVVAPIFTPVHIDIRLLEPARGHAVYILLFCIGVIYVPSVGAEIGRSQVRHNHRLFWRSQGVRDSRYFAALCLAVSWPVVVIGSVGGFLIAGLGSHGISGLSLFEAIALTGLASYVVVPLVIGVSQLWSSSIAVVVSLAVNFVGYYVPSICAFIRSDASLSQSYGIWAEILTSLIPHLRIGDHAERIAFSWPAMPLPVFFAASAYLVGWIAVSWALGFALFRRRSF